MNKNTVIAIVIVVIILILAFLFLMGNKANNGQTANNPAGNSQNPVNPAPAATNSGAQNQANTFAGSLSDLMGKKTPQNCQVSFDQNGTTQTQSLYFDGTNLRTDMVINIGGQQNT